MKVFKAVETPQIIKLRTRTLDTEVLVLLTEEMSGETVYAENQVGILTDEYLALSIEFGFKAGEEYTVKVLNIDELIIWRGKAYVTDQEDLQNYKLSNE